MSYETLHRMIEATRKRLATGTLRPKSTAQIREDNSMATFANRLIKAAREYPR